MKIVLCLGGSSANENYVVASLAALNIITGEKPEITQQKGKLTDEAVGGNVTLRS